MTLLILGRQRLAREGDKSKMLSTSGTVTRIWQLLRRTDQIRLERIRQESLPGVVDAIIASMDGP